MMNLSRRFLRSFGLIPITVFAVGCVPVTCFKRMGSVSVLV